MVSVFVVTAVDDVVDKEVVDVSDVVVDVVVDFVVVVAVVNVVVDGNGNVGIAVKNVKASVEL